MNSTASNLHDAWKAVEAGRGPMHQWRVAHVDADGTRRIQRVPAPTSWHAMQWMEQLYGLPRAVAAIRLTKSTETTASHA